MAIETKLKSTLYITVCSHAPDKQLALQIGVKILKMSYTAAR